MTTPLELREQILALAREYSLKVHAGFRTAVSSVLWGGYAWVSKVGVARPHLTSTAISPPCLTRATFGDG